MYSCNLIDSYTLISCCRCKEGKHHAMHCNLKCCEDACTARKDCNFAIYFSDDGCQLAPTCNALTDAYEHKGHYCHCHHCYCQDTILRLLSARITSYCLSSGVTEKIFEKQQEAATEAAAAKEAAEEEAAAKEAAEKKRKEEEAAAKALEEKRLKEEADAKAKQEADDKAAAEKATAAKKAEDEANAKLAAEEARIRRAAEAAAAKKAEEAAASVNCDTLLEQCLWMKDNSEYPQFEQMYCYLDGDTKYGGPRPCCTAVIKEKLGDKCTWPSQNK